MDVEPRISVLAIDADPRAMTEVSVPAVDLRDARSAAFARLVDAQLDASYRLAAVILTDALEAEDAVHDAALVAWGRFASLRDPERFDAWFGRILVNGCRDRLRRRRRREIVDLAAVDEIAVPASLRVVDPAGALIDRLALARAIAALDVDHRLTLVLRFYLDLSVDSIAERLDLPAGTVKSRLHHALRKVRAELERTR